MGLLCFTALHSNTMNGPSDQYSYKNKGPHRAENQKDVEQIHQDVLTIRKCKRKSGRDTDARQDRLQRQLQLSGEPYSICKEET